MTDRSLSPKREVQMRDKPGVSILGSDREKKPLIIFRNSCKAQSTFDFHLKPFEATAQAVQEPAQAGAEPTGAAVWLAGSAYFRLGPSAPLAELSQVAATLVRTITPNGVASICPSETTSENINPVSTMASTPKVSLRERLKEGECFWRDHQPWLHECGYSLRPRYQPGWIPSWNTDPKKLPSLCEDGIVLTPVQIIDAIRMEDGASVVLKVISKRDHPDEARIFEYFSSKELASDPRNHCLPLLGQLQIPDDEDKLIFVMKLMRMYNSPRFETFGEAVEFMGQIFEHLYPNGFHPVYQDSRADRIYRRAKYYTRTQRPVKYYFIDFGISVKFELGEDTLAYPIGGGDHSAPEIPEDYLFRPPTRLNPFPTDIYYLGNVIRTEFLDVSSGLIHHPGYQPLDIPPKQGFDFVRPLVSDMVQDDPSKRPTIDEVVDRFDKIRNELSSWKLRSRIVKEGESHWHWARVVEHWFRRIGFVLMRVPAVPAPKP
ncbi:hypothetical protein DFH07DRAFT_764611 [Mycena maculata]|uniref:Protein kinase domain-containing protein n=1 Tax=Mycena maculata TaxID=230809 RepID=A0AAD7NZR8_9AGAR|nr:hypothetical protein DFH07DRAFT_764611 [Mycena maculata]